MNEKEAPAMRRAASCGTPMRHDTTTGSNWAPGWSPIPVPTTALGGLH